MAVILGLVLPFSIQGQFSGTDNKRSSIIVYPKPGESVAQLKQYSVKQVDNYGSYWVVRGTVAQTGAIQKAFGSRAVKADYLDHVQLAVTDVDTSAGEPAIPGNLQQGEPSGKRLRLIQFKGPIQPDWLDQVKAAGDLQIVSYIPNNAYLVYLDGKTEATLNGLKVPNGPLQWIGRYHPYYKINPILQKDTASVVKIRVGLVNGSETEQNVAELQSLALSGIEGRDVVMNQTSITIQVRPVDLPRIAQMAAVLWVEPVFDNIKMDEMQALIVSGYTNDPVNHGPQFGDSYMNFLNGLGFSISPSAYPVVDVADTGLDKPNPFPNLVGCGWGNLGVYHPSFYTSGLEFAPPFDDAVSNSMCCRISETRVVYNVGTDTDGHGTRVASLLAGFDIAPDERVLCLTDQSGTRSTTNVANNNIYKFYAFTNYNSSDITICPDCNPFSLDPNYDSVPGESCIINNPNFCVDPLAQSVCTPDLSNILTPNCHGWVTTVSNSAVCLIYTNTPPTPTSVVRPNPFLGPGGLGEYLYHRDGFGFQFGLGVSPFGRIGASFGGNAAGFAGPAGEISSAYLQSARISNNSWGQALVIGGNDGVYDPVAQVYDTLVRDAVQTGITISQRTNNLVVPPVIILVTNSTPNIQNQEMTIVFPAGDANGIGPNGGFGDVLVTPPATAKNVITVGGTKSTRPAGFAADHDNAEAMASFSSFGPTRDGRFKPEIVAPATEVTAATSQGWTGYPQIQCLGCGPNNPLTPTCASGEQTYQTIILLYSVIENGVSYYQGTSLAAPVVSGGAQLLWWWFQNSLNMLQPSPAMVKAYMLNSATYLAITNSISGGLDTLPSSAQGMGRLDLARMFDSTQRILRDETSQRAIDTPVSGHDPIVQQTFFSASGQSYELSGTVADSTKPFRVTLSWVDAAGAPSALKELVNDLDLQVSVGGNTYNGNQFIGANSAPGCVNPNIPCPDNINNTESVFLPPGLVTAGTRFTVLVRASNIVLQGVPNVNTPSGQIGQDYALVVYNAATNTSPSSLAASDAPNPHPIQITNNSCQTAIVLSNFPASFANLLTSNVYNNVHPSPTAGQGGIEEFLKIPAPTQGTLFTVTSTGANSLLSIWRGICGTLVEVISSAAQPASLDFATDGSEDYYIIVDGMNGGNATVNLTVSRTIPPVTVSPSLLDFGNQVVGTLSVPGLVSINASGSNAVTVSSVTLGGLNPGSFLIVSNPCVGTTIAPGGNCNLSISFGPLGLGVVTSILTVVTSGPATNTVVLTGNGVPANPAIAITPLTLSFGDQTVGSTSAVQSVTVTNVGNAPLLIGSIKFVLGNSLDFVVVTNTCVGVPIPPNGFCTINVGFQPTGIGSRTSFLQILSNAGTGTNTISAMGTGVAPGISISPTNLNFGTLPVGVTSTPQTVTLFNSGNSPLTVSSATVGGANPGDFIITANSCLSNAIPPGSSCGISLVFAAGALGSRTATLQIVGNSTNSPFLVSLTGTGATNVPAIQISPTSLFFGDQVVGTTSIVQQVTVTNTGVGSLSITNVAFSGGNFGDFVLTNVTCLGVPIAPGGICVIGVEFAPVTSGVRASTLGIFSNAGSGVVDVPVSGSGIAPVIAFSANSLDFGTNAVNTTSVTKSVFLKNIGNAAFLISSNSITLGGLNPGDFIILANLCTGNLLLPNQECEIDIAFRTTVALPRSALLIVSANAINSPQALPLTGVGGSFVCPPIIISPPFLPDASLGASYFQAVSGTNGVPPFSVLISSGALPSGLALTRFNVSSNATTTVIVGVPTTVGNFTFTLQATDANGCSGTATYQIAVGCSSLSLFPASFPAASLGTPYVQTSFSIGATFPVTFAVTGGSLPPGLTYSSGGVLSGTPNTVGTFNFTVTATDANGCTATNSYSINVGCAALSLQPQALPVPAFGVPYSQALTVNGTSGTMTFMKTAGSLPPGLNMSSSGLISGTPTAFGSFTFQVTAISASNCQVQRFYTVKIGCDGFTLSPASPLLGNVGGLINTTFIANGGTPPYAFTQTGGSLPSGISLSTAGKLYGTPTSGSSVFTITVKDAGGCQTNFNYTIVLANNCPPVSVSPSTLPNGAVGASYSQTLSASGGTSPHSFLLYSGALPAGLTLSSAGLLSGAPISSGASTFTVAGLDANGCAGFQTYTVNSACDAVTISPSALATGAVGLAYSQVLTATGVAPATFAMTSGTLPGGIVLNNSGTLSGAPTSAGTFVFTVTVTDAAGCSANRSYSLTTVPNADVAITKTVSPDPVVVGSNLTYTIVVTNLGPGPATGVVVTDVWPSGLTFVSMSSGCSALNNVVTCNLGTLASGASTTLTIVANATVAQIITNTASVASVGFDPNPVNNTATTVSTANTLVAFASASQIVAAKAGAVVVNVTRLGDSQSPVTVQFATSDGSAVAGVDYSATSGLLTFDPGVLSLTFTVPIGGGGSPTKSSLANKASKTFHVALQNPVGASLGNLSTATVDIVGGTAQSFPDVDGDTVTVKLTGAGSMQIALAGNGVGPISQIQLFNTDATSSLSIAVKRGAGGDGRVDIGSIVGAGGLKSLTAPAANLVGGGLNLVGSIGSVKVNKVINSLVSSGFTPANGANPMAGGAFAATGSQIKSVSAQSFAGSVIAAGQIGNVKLGQVTTDNAGQSFGVLGNVTVVSVSNPKFRWPANQSLGDFHVQQ
jgi:uncharacterized repeat protein (TIGR01451 family)